MEAPFIGRESEMSELEALYNAPGPKTYAVYGRRRVGKSRLLREFCSGKRSLIFQFIDRSLEENLEYAGVAVSDFIGKDVEFKSMTKFLKHLKQICEEERTIVVMDEFPYLVGSDTTLSTSIQRFIDQDLIGTDSMLIVCGSSISMMRDLLESEKQPLYSRFPDKKKLKPLNLRQCAQFHPRMGDVDILKTYLTVGGMPMYHLQMSEDTYEASVKKAFLVEQAPLTSEFEAAIEFELSPKHVYSRMLQAMSKGASTQSEVARDANISPSLCSRYMENLEKIGFISKGTPVLNMKESRFYRISDPLLLFGYQVVRRVNLSGYEDVDRLYRRCAPRISTYMGKAFEDVVTEYIGMTYHPSRIGKWIGRVDGTMTDIDVVAEIDTGEGYDLTLLCECKFRTSEADMRDMEDLEHRADEAGCRLNRRFAIASVGGFTRELEEYAEDNGVMLIGLDEIMGRKEPAPLVQR
ncbi:MAG: ATP-binding protein [Thermoplasmata archaeon]|nr:ATP-binding protein [Thermoplasmata archaeon]